MSFNHVIKMLINFSTYTTRSLLDHIWYLWGLEIKGTTIINKVKAIEQIFVFDSIK